MYAKSQLVLRT